MPKASAVLESAINVLKPEGAWCKGEFHEQEDEGRPVAHCAVGGIHAVTRELIFKVDEGGWIEIYDSDKARKGYIIAEEKAKQYLAAEAKKKLSSELYDEMYDEGNFDSVIIAFNDHNDLGSKKSVLAAFRRALKKAIQNGD